jgi:hypothetical protein
MKDIWSALTSKRQLILRQREGDRIYWKVGVSPLALWGGIIGLLAVIFFTLLILMAHTTILDMFPKYRTHSEKLNEELIESIMRLDLMERNMNDILAYNEAVATIMGGSTPALHSTVLTDTIRYDKSRILPTRADSLLRAALESTTNEYSLTNTKPLQGQAAMFSTPMRGNITRNFDAPESSYDMAIVSISGDDSVMAIENGTVVGIQRDADGKSTVMLHHAEGYVSVYKQLEEVLVRKGQRVTSGNVIGRLLGEDSDAMQSPELVFELWRDGTAVDPERYILF